MSRAIARGVVCTLLVLPQFGCQGVYRFRCTSKPSGAGVLVGEEVLGETACNIRIPKKSKLIRDGKIELTFCLSDGRERTQILNLHKFKPTNPIAEVVAAPFLLAGVGLLALALNGGDSEDSSLADENESENVGGRVLTAVLGLGVVGIGVGVYALLGGHPDSLNDYPVRVDFTEPPSGDQPVLPPPRQEDGGMKKRRHGGVRSYGVVLFAAEGGP
jgi:hypothetical protein